MITMTELKDFTGTVRNWWFGKKIEDMSDEELKKRIEQVMALDFKLDIRPIPYIGDREIVQYYTDELIGLCPMTGYPDIYKLTIRFYPCEKIPELKSLKMYLMNYLNVPISHEHLADKIYNDFNERIISEKTYLKLEVARRGGIDTTIEKGDKI